MSTALVLRQRWAVEDPIIDCAIMILDMNQSMEYSKQYQEEVQEYDDMQFYFWDDAWSRSMSLNRSSEHCKSVGKMGYVWISEPWKQASEILDCLSMIAYEEWKISQILQQVNKNAANAKEI